MCLPIIAGIVVLSAAPPKRTNMESPLGEGVLKAATHT